MQALITDQVRLLALVGLCGLLWSLESIAPLYRYQKGRVRHALPNVALAVILVLTNLALSFSSAYAAGFTVRHGLGLFPLLDISLWAQAVLGIVALDLFGYFAHVCCINRGWVGNFIASIIPKVLVDVTTAFRQHPGETVWRLLWQLAGIVAFGIPLWIVIIYLILSALNAQLEHANIKLNGRLDGFLRLVIVTPHMHKVHHSRDQRADRLELFQHLFLLGQTLRHLYGRSRLSETPLWTRWL